MTDTAIKCEGRWVRVVIGSTLAQECTDCLRRTDVPADVKSVPWAQPPAVHWYDAVCPQYVGPEDEAP